MTKLLSLRVVGLLASAAFAVVSAPTTVRSAETPQAFRFITVSDTHFSARAKDPRKQDQFVAFLNHAKSLGADFVLIAGDLNGDATADAVLPEVKQLFDAS